MQFLTWKLFLLDPLPQKEINHQQSTTTYAWSEFIKNTINQGQPHHTNKNYHYTQQWPHICNPTFKNITPYSLGRENNNSDIQKRTEKPSKFLLRMVFYMEKCQSLSIKFSVVWKVQVQVIWLCNYSLLQVLQKIATKLDWGLGWTWLGFF